MTTRLSPGPSTGPPTIQRRSRSGCYTCRLRKVKCEAVASSSDARKDGTSRECHNCQRLGFDCKWQAPVAGEKYEPPPKRRRAATSRREAAAADVSTIITTPSHGDRDEEGAHNDSMSPSLSATSAVVSQDMQMNQNGAGTDSFFNINTDTPFQNLPLEDGFTLGSTFMDFNLDAEGMDFIPLPMIDPSLLPAFTDPSQTEPVAQWPQLNFTLGGIAPPPKPIDEEKDESDEVTAGSPSVTEDNRRLVQHYLDVMKGYSKVDEPSKDANNLFISAFSRSLCFPPLFSAILAFSAAHLSIQDSSYADQAISLDRSAQKSIKSFRRDHEMEVEGLLSALFICVKRIHVMGDDVDSFLELISEAADIISTAPGQKALEDSSTLTRRIILRLAILDARAACFCLGGGILVKRLKSMPPLSDIFRDKGTPESIASIGPVASLLRANVFRMRVAELDTRLRDQLASDSLAHPMLKRDDFTDLFAEIQHEIGLWDQMLVSHGLEAYAGVGTETTPLDSRSFSCSATLSVLHSALLYLDHMFPLPIFDQDGTAAKLLHHQLRLHNDASRKDSPSSTSPSSLFLAALLTKDPIHRDWVLKIIRKGERWGLYVTKTRQLLEAIFEMQLRGEKWEVADVMDQITGRFII